MTRVTAVLGVRICQLTINPHIAWLGLSSRPAEEMKRALVGMVLIQLERNGALFGAHGRVRPKNELTEPTLSETLIDIVLSEVA